MPINVAMAESAGGSLSGEASMDPLSAVSTMPTLRTLRRNDGVGFIRFIQHCLFFVRLFFLKAPSCVVLIFFISNFLQHKITRSRRSTYSFGHKGEERRNKWHNKDWRGRKGNRIASCGRFEVLRNNLWRGYAAEDKCPALSRANVGFKAAACGD